MTKREKLKQEIQREEARTHCAAGKHMPIEDALVEGTASGVSPRTIPDIIRDTKARLGISG
jgi:hypothetical protein